MQRQITAEIAGPRNAGLLNVAIGSALVRVNRLAFVAGAPHHYVDPAVAQPRMGVDTFQTAAELDAGDGFAIAHDVRRGPS